VTSLAHQTVEEMPKIVMAANNIVTDMDDIRVVTKGLSGLEHDISYIARSAKRTLDDV
jgi:hypothetical protein